MENFLIVHVFQSETNLGKPVQNFIFIEILRFACWRSQLILILYFRLQVTTVAVIHDNTKFALFGFVNFSEASDIRMIQNFQNFGFS